MKKSWISFILFTCFLLLMAVAEIKSPMKGKDEVRGIASSMKKPLR